MNKVHRKYQFSIGSDKIKGLPIFGFVGDGVLWGYSVEEQWQIAKEIFDILHGIADDVARKLKKSVVKRDECKEHLETLSKSGDSSLIEESAKTLQKWEKVITDQSEQYKEATNELWEISKKMRMLTHQLKY